MLQKKLVKPSTSRILHDSVLVDPKRFGMLPGDCKWDRKKVPDSLEAKHLSSGSKPLMGGVHKLWSFKSRHCFSKLFKEFSWFFRFHTFKESNRNILLKCVYIYIFIYMNHNWYKMQWKLQETNMNQGIRHPVISSDHRISWITNMEDSSSVWTSWVSVVVLSFFWAQIIPDGNFQTKKQHKNWRLRKTGTEGSYIWCIQKASPIVWCWFLSPVSESKSATFFDHSMFLQVMSDNLNHKCIHFLVPNDLSSHL